MTKLSWKCPKPECQAQNLVDIDKLFEASAEQKDLIIVCANCGYAERNDARRIKEILQRQETNDLDPRMECSMARCSICSKTWPFHSDILTEGLSDVDIVRRYGVDPKIHKKFTEKDSKTKNIRNWKNIR
jgi:hypothetical protein